MASLVVGFVLFSASGCAQIFRGGSADISIAASPVGATVSVDGQQCPAPCTLSLSRNRSHLMTIGKPGYHDVTVRISSSVSVGWVIGELLLWGLIGLVVDFSGGGIYNLDPSNVVVTLQPLPGPPLDGPPGVESDVGARHPIAVELHCSGRDHASCTVRERQVTGRAP